MHGIKPSVALVVTALAGLAFLTSGRSAFAEYNAITTCYDDPTGIAPPVCYGRQGQNMPAAPEPDVWGALAISPTTFAWGSSWNYDNQKQAQRAALRNCNARDCRIVVTVPDVCVAFVTSPAQHVYAIGGPIGARNFAADAAVLKCQRAGGKSCAVVTTICADGQRHNLNGHTEYFNGNPVFLPNGQKPFGRR